MTAPAYDTDRLIDAYLPVPTGPDLDAENALLAAIRLHRRQVADACTGRKTLYVGTADIERGGHRG